MCIPRQFMVVWNGPVAALMEPRGQDYSGVGLTIMGTSLWCSLVSRHRRIAADGCPFAALSALGHDHLIDAGGLAKLELINEERVPVSVH